jgi:4-hydroxy-tetrahydrodipicolinate reductase
MKGEKIMRIAIIGYGSMGKEIEVVAKEKSILITNIFDIDSQLQVNNDLEKNNLEKNNFEKNNFENNNYDFDVAIDFSTPSSVLDNVKLLAKLKKNIVIGATGWYAQIDEIKKIVLENDIGCIWSSNFSIGMQIFFRTLTVTTKLANQFKLYDTFIGDIHHRNKVDSPSGTATRLANIIVENSDEKNTILCEQINRKISSEELHIAALRGGSIFGTHTVYFDSIADTIELIHRAKSRRGFAEGAIEASKWIHNKKGFYCFDDILFENIPQ